MAIPLVVIAGPTGVGKTKISIELAERLNAEIISADSRQIYKGMDIGTAKPTPEERGIIPHHLIDIVEPDERFAVADYQKLAEEVIDDIHQRGKLPLLVGGTGLYIKAVVEGGYIFPGPSADRELRDGLKREADQHGSEYLYNKLKEVDPAKARETHPRNLRRIIRALEVYYLTGKPISELQAEWAEAESGYNSVLMGLIRPREELYRRIDSRVDEMMEAGLVEEVERLISDGYDEGAPAWLGLGYRQIIGYLKGLYDLDEAIYLIKRDTRRYAKRQLTWFRKVEGIRWFGLEKYRSISDILGELERYIYANI